MAENQAGDKTHSPQIKPMLLRGVASPLNRSICPSPTAPKEHGDLGQSPMGEAPSICIMPNNTAYTAVTSRRVATPNWRGTPHVANGVLYGSSFSAASSIFANDSGSASRCSCPTTIRADSGRPLLRRSSSAVGKRHHVVGLGMQDDRAGLDRPGRTPSLPGRAEQDQRRRTDVDVHGDGTAPAGTDNDIGLMPVELGLGDADGGVEIVVGQGRVQDFVAVVLEVGRLDAARCRLPAVEEEDFHGPIVAAQRNRLKLDRSYRTRLGGQPWPERSCEATPEVRG